jgi:lysophospholipase L1-like esterase
MNLIFFGDSVMQGLWDEKGGWVSRIKQDIYSEHLEGAEPWEDYNIVYMRANSSETSEGLKNRVFDELKAARDKSDHDWTIVFSIGMNDCVIDKGGDPKVSRSDYRENIREIIKDAGKIVDQVIAVGLIPVDESRVGPDQREEYYLNEEVSEFDSIFAEVCEEKDVKFISVFREVSEDWDEKLFDGLHPITEGHREIYEIAKRPIMDELELDLSED